MSISNRRALHDYEIVQTLEAGMHLNGAEVKSIKGNRMSLEGSFVKVIGNEIYLVNAQIMPYPYARPEGYDPKRSRKLLLHKKEILALKTHVDSQRLTLIPLECYNHKGILKLKIALAKGRKEFQKREKIKRQDIQRETDREIRGRK